MKEEIRKKWVDFNWSIGGLFMWLNIIDTISWDCKKPWIVKFYKAK